MGLPRGTVRSVLALMITGTICFLFATGNAVPGELLVLGGTAIAFYFDSRSNSANDAATIALTSAVAAAVPPAEPMVELSSPYAPGPGGAGSAG